MYWMDLADGDLTFYHDLFGWQPDAAGVFTVDGQVVAGHGAPAAPGYTGWTVRTVVDDVAAACAAAREHGGRVLVEPTASAVGEVAVLADPSGAVFAVGAPGTGPQLLHKPDLYSWTELCTSDYDGAKSFYPTVFGWTTVDIQMQLPAGLAPYTVFMHGESEMGGLLPSAAGFVPAEAPYWLPYVEVLDADAVAARVRELDGAVVVEPFDIPRIGRVAVFAGRTGETFAVMQMPA